MLDKRTLGQWLRIADTTRAATADLYMAGSRMREENPTLAEYLNAVATTLGTAARMLDKVILLAAADSPTDPGELVGEKEAK